MNFFNKCNDRCFSFKNNYCLGDIPPARHLSSFGGTIDIITATLHVTGESLETYMAADLWKDFGTIVKL